MPEIHLKQPRFTYSVCGPVTKNKERIQNFKETRDTKYFYRNEWNKAYFQHDMSFGDFKDWAKRTDSNKVLRDKAFNIAKNPKYDGIKKALLLWFTNVFIKRLKVVVLIIYNVKELIWMFHRVIHFWFLLNFLYISDFFDILAALSISAFFQAAFQADQYPPA